MDFALLKEVCTAVKRCVDMGVELGLVVGGGNFWRGAKDGGGYMERSRADHMGMLATVMNALALCDVFEQIGARACVMTMADMPRFANALHAEGRLLLSGFYEADAACLLEAAGHWGFGLERRTSEDGWTMLVMKRGKR